MSKNLIKFDDVDTYIEGTDEIVNNATFAIADEDGIIIGYKDERGEVFTFKGGEETDVVKHYYAVFADGSKKMLDGLTEIHETTFTFAEKRNLVSVEIPKSVTKIRTFQECIALTSIVIPNSVTSIGINAFRGCSSLSSVVIPNSVTSIDNYTFSACSSLSSITIPDSVTLIGNWAFGECSSLSSVSYNGVTYTSNSALTSALKDSGVTLGIGAFYGTALTA